MRWPSSSRTTSTSGRPASRCTTSSTSGSGTYRCSDGGDRRGGARRPPPTHRPAPVRPTRGGRRTTEPTDLADLTAARLTAGYAAGEFSPVEAARAVLERAEAAQAATNCFTLIDADEALADAEESAER